MLRLGYPFFDLEHVKLSMTTVTSRAPEMSSIRISRVLVPVLGVGDQIGEGDTYLVKNILPSELAEVAFENLKKEVAWNAMHHRGASPSPFLICTLHAFYRW